VEGGVVDRSPAPSARDFEGFEIDKILRTTGGVLHRDQVVDGGN
jgi:hypothetical protein